MKKVIFVLLVLLLAVLYWAGSFSTRPGNHPQVDLLKHRTFSYSISGQNWEMHSDENLNSGEPRPRQDRKWFYDVVLDPVNQAQVDQKLSSLGYVLVMAAKIERDNQPFLTWAIWSFDQERPEQIITSSGYRIVEAQYFIVRYDHIYGSPEYHPIDNDLSTILNYWCRVAYKRDGLSCINPRQ